MRRQLVLPDAAALAAVAAKEFVRAVSSSSGPFRVALSGGSTPRALYSLLAGEEPPWSRLHFFWSDERCVPPDHADSNYRMASEALLSRVPLPPANVHRIEGELADADEAARRYEVEIRRDFAGAEPRFDWIFLGLGADGHTASLFPGTTAVAETKKLATSVWVPDKRSHRVTFTLPLLNAAKTVAFLVSGSDKAEIARQVLEEPPSRTRPASLVNPSGELLWFLDRDAAARLAR
jgi:6-phosphogluconolactonase